MKKDGPKRVFSKSIGSVNSSEFKCNLIEV